MTRKIRLAWVDAETNQEIQWEDMTSDERESLSGEFAKLFNAIIDSFFKQDLSKGALKLSIYIWVAMVYCNRYYYDRTKAAKVLNIQPSNVSGALTELVNNNFCVPAPDEKSTVYIVNPDIAFKGTEGDRAITRRYYQKLRYQMDQPPQNTAVNPAVAQFIGLSEERQKLAHYLQANSDDKKCVYKQVNEIVQSTGVSKPSVIKFLKFMEDQKVISRPRRGLIKVIGEFC